MDRSKTIALVLGPSLAVLALLAGYFWKDHVSGPGTPLELHGGAGASSQQAAADVAANAGSLSPLEPNALLERKPEKTVPQFDVVRVEPKGDALVAGRTEPNAKVAVLSDGKVIVEGKADANGQFALLPPKLEPGGHNLALQSTSPKGGAPVQSDQRVAVYIPREKGEEVAVALAEPGKPTLLLQDPTAAAEKADATVPDVKAQPLPVPQPEVAQAPAAKDAPPAAQAAPAKPETKQPPAAAKNKVAAKPEAPAVKPESFAAKVPSEAKPELAGKDEPAAKSESEAKVLDLRPSVSIKTAEVVEPGGFFASGLAAAGAQVRLYLNGSLLAEVLAGKDGHWSMKVGKGLIPGQYAVRADQVDGKGQVLARAEVLFLYKNEQKLADKTASPEAQPESTASTPEVSASGKTTSAKPENAVVAEIQTTTVERGNNLWRISRHTLGRGTRYTEIYAANSTQIRDPKLIYPGQVFVIPGQIN